MTVLRGLSITILSGVFFGIGGSAIGYALGLLAPDFFRTVFRIPDAAELDPIQIGVGLGLCNGGLVGLGIGLVIVVAVTWYNGRTAMCGPRTP